MIKRLLLPKSSKDTPQFTARNENAQRNDHPTATLSLTCHLPRKTLLHILSFLNSAQLCELICPYTHNLCYGPTKELQQQQQQHTHFSHHSWLNITSLHQFIIDNAVELQIFHPILKIGVILEDIKEFKRSFYKLFEQQAIFTDKNIKNTLRYVQPAYSTTTTTTSVASIDQLPHGIIFETDVHLNYEKDTHRPYVQKVTIFLDFAGRNAIGCDGYIHLDFFHASYKKGERFCSTNHKLTLFDNVAIVDCSKLPSECFYSKYRPTENLPEFKRYHITEFITCLQYLFVSSRLGKSDLIYTREQERYATDHTHDRLSPMDSSHTETSFNLVTSLLYSDDHFGTRILQVSNSMNGNRDPSMLRGIFYGASKSAYNADPMQVFSLIGWVSMTPRMKARLIYRWFYEFIFKKDLGSDTIILDSSKKVRSNNRWRLSFKKACPFTELTPELITVTPIRLTNWDRTRKHALLDQYLPLQSTTNSPHQAFITVQYWAARLDKLQQKTCFRKLSFHFDPYEVVTYTSVDPTTESINTFNFRAKISSYFNSDSSDNGDMSELIK